MHEPRPPSVDALARALSDLDLPHPVLVDVARQAVEASRDSATASSQDEILHAARNLGAQWKRSRLQPVVNATGVLLHTNLGRAPFAHTQEAVATNLELDLTTGERGDRQAHTAAQLALACGAEAAMVVNNGAAAVLLAVSALASGRGVVVSRGELVEIGGGFRIPDVLAQSGARLVEVGTTNRTRAHDYREVCDAAHKDVAMVLKVHRSNFEVTGFTHDADVEELSNLGVPLVVDLGSGLLDEACPWLADGPPAWLRNEPAARQTLAAGATLVTFSGDKLLGGSQAGVLAGSAALVQRCARHPLARALRPSGLALAALQETLSAYLRRDGASIPFWRQATQPEDVLRARAEHLVDGSGVGSVVSCSSVTGGGTLPGVQIPSIAVALDGDHTAWLRTLDPPIIARSHQGATLLDLRTVDPSQDDLIRDALVALPRCAAETDAGHASGLDHL